MYTARSQNTRDVSRNARRRFWAGASVPTVGSVMGSGSGGRRARLSRSNTSHPLEGEGLPSGESTSQAPRGPVDQKCMEMTPSFTSGRLVGDDVRVPVLGGAHRRYVDLDTAATSSASSAVVRAVENFLPWY